MASYSALPEPMLARSGRLPTSGDFAYEVKWGRVPGDLLDRMSAFVYAASEVRASGVETLPTLFLSNGRLWVAHYEVVGAGRDPGGNLGRRSTKMMRKHFRFKSLVLGFAFGLAMAAFSASAVRAEPTSGYGPLDPWAYGLIHRSTQANVVPPAKYGPLDPWAYAVIHRSSTGSIVPPDVRDHRLVAQLVAQAGSSDSYIGHPGGPGAAGPVLPEYDGVPLNRNLVGGPGGAGPVLSVPAQSTGERFDWGDAGIGASVSFGAVLLLLTAATLGRRYRRQIDLSGLATDAPATDAP